MCADPERSSHLSPSRSPMAAAVARDDDDDDTTMSVVAGDGDDDTKMREDEAIAWSNLLPEVLSIIAQNLTSIWDYVRFRGVCSSWRSAASPAGTPPAVPSLILPYDLLSTTRSFLNPSDRRIHTIYLPESQGQLLYGTPHGWLVMLGKPALEEDGGTYTVSLLNPITRAHIHLPPIPAELTASSRSSRQISGYNLTHSTKPLLSADPSSSSHSLLAIMIASRLAVCRLGDEETWIPIRLHVPIVDFAYSDGVLYVVDAYKWITVIDIISLEKKYLPLKPDEPPAPHFGFRLRRPRLFSSMLYLVESSGDLLLLERIKRGFGSVIDIYKLDMSGTELEWVVAGESVVDRMLFVTENHSSISQPGRHLCYFAGNRGNANLCISDIVASSSIVHQTYNWQELKKPPVYGSDLVGLTWFIPRPC